MQVQFELVIGENKFTLIETVESNVEFFQKLNFYSTLPKVGPNGETDLVLTYRVAQKQYEYYSIVSKKANMEFKFGQSKDAKGVLFAKGWEPLYNANSTDDAGGEAQDGQSVGGLGAPMAVSAPAQQAAAPRTAQTAGLGATAAPKPAAPTATVTAPTNSAVPTQVQNQAKSVLSKFGI